MRQVAPEEGARARSTREVVVQVLGTLAVVALAIVTYRLHIDAMWVVGAVIVLWCCYLGWAAVRSHRRRGPREADRTE
ncbi:MAG: hypothetical protein J0H73_10005 [Salana multivorans]|uniref:hypothetical protein n=1 Tax=Salana multivorans TaxID=120377 RepID=UPI00095E9B5F|nr:hypothetical protein [Salana multivorans]MBN8882633.1 hypothetical protein [Salana multivorans]OJX97813.1 MAG: hypothetical protein BGO96_12850 [Micrococcales bacterium 73-15]